MQINPREMLAQFAHVLQQDLYPAVQPLPGELSDDERLLIAVMALIPLERMLSARRSGKGRPAKGRAALCTAFVAKSILNLSVTRDLIARLRVDESLRRLCGWQSTDALPHESKFSRAFAEFAQTELPQQLHAAVVAATQQDRLIGHIARDSTAIPARERFPETAKQKAAKRREATRQKRQAKVGGGNKAGGGKKAKPVFRKTKASERGTRIERQRHQKLDRMLKELPRECDIGTKTSSQGHQQYWRGYKLHLDVADGQLPISAILTSASVNDSQVAIPLMTMTGERVVYLYDLMDSAYDANGIHAHSRQLNHVPIIAPHPRRGTKKPSQI